MEERLWHKNYDEDVFPSLTYSTVPLKDVLVKAAQEYPMRDALIFLDTKITYGELNNAANRFANALIALGVNPGDKVALLMPNMPQFVIATYGVWKAGGVVVPNNPLYTDDELEYQLNNSDSVLLVTLDLLADRMIALKPRTQIKTIVVVHIQDYLEYPEKQTLPVVEEDKESNRKQLEGVCEWLDLQKKYPATDPGIENNLDDLGALFYTGGTTGVSKGVMLPHSNLSINTQQVLSWYPTFRKADLVMIGAIPFFHCFGFTCSMNYAVWMAWTNVLIPRPDPYTLLEVIQKYKAQLFLGVPTMYIGMMNYPDLSKYELSSLIHCACGSSPLPSEVLNRFESLTGTRVLDNYGLTETTPGLIMSPYAGKRKKGAAGIPIPDTDLKIVDIETGETEMPVGEAGEILVKGPQITAGYYKMPGETAVAIIDGWLYTGDIGKIDEDGFLYILDRKKDLIIASGYNIYPNEIDKVLYSHPKIEQACTIGVPHEYRGETVKAFVVMREGETMSEAEVIDFCSEHLAVYKVPKIVEFISALPTSAVGKVLRKKLREMEMEKIKIETP
jgi:long-chain acyl-CoA synthetase